MSIRLPVSTTAVLSLVGILGAATGAPAQTTTTVASLVYLGHPHSAIGNAVLQLNSQGTTLEVRTTDPKGGDGVAVRLPSTTTEWIARAGIRNGDLPLVLSLSAIAEGQRISTAVLRELDDRIALSAGFTGGTTAKYSALIYNQGTLVASLGGLPPTARIHLPRWIACEFLEGGCPLVARFRNTVNGECEWDFVLAGAQPITLPNGRKVTGTEVRLIEEVNPAGHYPYLSFDGLTMQTNARVLTLFAESAR